MVNKQEHLDALFFALSDPTRRAIVTHLAKGKSTMGQVAQPFSMSLVAVSKHVRVLEDAGLVKRKVMGRVHELTLAPKALDEAEAWIERMQAFWKGSLESLARHLESPDLAKTEAKPDKKKKGDGKKKKKKKDKK